MKPETKLVEGSAITFLIALLAAIHALQPSGLSAAALASAGLLVILALRRLQAGNNPSGRVPSVSPHALSHGWSSRGQNPDRLLDQLVPRVTDFITNVREGGGVVDEAKIRQELHRSLACYLAESDGLADEGHITEITIVLSDLRGFSVMTQGCTAPEVVDMLNRYFTRMCEIIYHWGGTVDKFMGDSVMALFGAPVNRGKETEHAVCCAAEMQIAMDGFNKENQTLGMPNLYMGIGINTGRVVAGKIGSDLHSEFTVIGDEVNLASRIEAYTLRGQILLSENTHGRIKDLIRVREPIYVSVRGKSQPVPLYELLAIGEPFNLQVPDREARRSVRADVNIPFEFQICEGKVARSDSFEGQIMNISSGGMLAKTSAPVEPHFNIKFGLRGKVLGVESKDIYGTILRTKKNDETSEMNIEFTIIDPEDRELIQGLVNRIVRGTYSP